MDPKEASHTLLAGAGAASAGASAASAARAGGAGSIAAPLVKDALRFALGVPRPGTACAGSSAEALFALPLAADTCVLHLHADQAAGGESFSFKHHSENPERVRKIAEKLKGMDKVASLPCSSIVSYLRPIPATLAHTAPYVEHVSRKIDQLNESAKMGQTLLRSGLSHAPTDDAVSSIQGGAEAPSSEAVSASPDTLVGLGSGNDLAAFSAASRCAIDAILGGAAASAFVCARPPGHHAGAHRGGRESQMGFCMFNSSLLAAQYAMLRAARLGVPPRERIFASALVRMGRRQKEIVRRRHDPVVYFMSPSITTTADSALEQRFARVVGGEELALNGLCSIAAAGGTYDDCVRHVHSVMEGVEKFWEPNGSVPAELGDTQGNRDKQKENKAALDSLREALSVTERALLRQGAFRVAIVDHDAHCGDGASSLLRHMGAALGLTEHAFAALDGYIAAEAAARVKEASAASSSSAAAAAIAFTSSSSGSAHSALTQECALVQALSAD
jgi:acetoin utilization deacetylase AcuC-like enzyme